MATNKKWWNRSRRQTLFVVLMLAYPVFQFLFFWIFVNINSVIMTFQKYVIFPTEKFPQAGWNFTGFDNYKYIFESIRVNHSFRNMILNSLSYAGLNMLVILPISIACSYFLFKKVPLSGFFRALFYLPSIIPIVVLTLAFTTAIDPIRGVTATVAGWFGAKAPVFFSSDWSSQVTIWIFCLWSGLGYNIILLSGAMARVPIDILESGKLEGVSPMRELFQIIIPLIWPTLTTMTIFALMAVFNVALQPMLLSGNRNNTIGLYIFSISRSGNNLESAATLGMVCTLVAAPVIMIVKHFMEKCFADVSF